MSEWKECQIGDFIDVKHGFAFKGSHITDVKTLDVLVTPGNFHIGGGFKTNKFKYYNGEVPHDYILQENEIVVTMTDLSKESDTLGYSAKIPKSVNGIRYLHNQRVGLVQFKNSIVEKNFFYWVMRTRDYQGFIVGSASGTSIMHTSPTRIKEYRFLLPPLPEQKSIASVLSSLDDKIDLLHRQNETIEKMAETLFRKWFVEDADESWEEVELKYFGEIICGKTPPKAEKSYFDGSIPFIKIPDMHGKTFIFETQDSLTQLGMNFQKNKTLPPKSIIVSCIATVGLVSMNALLAQTNQQINSVIPRKENYRYYIYLHMKCLYEELQAMASGGTATLNLNTSNFSSIRLPHPDEKILKKFSKKVEKLFDKIFHNQTQIQTLTQLRDTLLPKLMSGEVRVKM